MIEVGSKADGSFQRAEGKGKRGSLPLYTGLAGALTYGSY